MDGEKKVNVFMMLEQEAVIRRSFSKHDKNLEATKEKPARF